MRCLSAMPRNSSNRFLNPSASCCQSKSWRNTRIVFIPMPAAQPSSVWIRLGSNVSACHISSSLIALAVRSWRRPATAAPCTNRWPAARTSGLASSMAPASARARRRPASPESVSAVFSCIPPATPIFVRGLRPRTPSHAYSRAVRWGVSLVLLHDPVLALWTGQVYESASKDELPPSSKLLTANDACALADHHELIRFHVRNLLGRPASSISSSNLPPPRLRNTSRGVRNG